MTSRRIQLSRAKGYRKPEGAIVVSRPSYWGNPFRVGDTYFVLDRQEYIKGKPLSEADWHRMTAQDAVDCYRRWLDHEVGRSGFTLAVEAKSELAGKTLACWCPLDQPCHGDVLLDLANPAPSGGTAP